MILGSILLLISILVFVSLIIINLPSDYFSNKDHKAILRNMIFPFNMIIIILKNGLGFILICFGILFLFIPGQGLLTIFTGLMLLNFPGKRRLELYIIRKKSVLNAINWLRVKSGKEKIVNIFGRE